MDSSSANQEMGSQTLESMLVCTRGAAQQQENNYKKPRPAAADEQSLKCPRCDSSNTKFCYYNNYSLSQPRYFCKSCRRYWTKGGTLRNVPVGGGCRKNKRSSTPNNSSSSSSTTSSTAKIRISQQDQTMMMNPSPLIPFSSSPYDHHHHGSCSDLSLAIARLHKQNPLGFDSNDHHLAATWANNNNNNNNPHEVLGMNSHHHVNTSLGLFDDLGSGGEGGFLHGHHHQQAHGSNLYGSLVVGMNGHDYHLFGAENSGAMMGTTVQDTDHHEYGIGVASMAVATLKEEIGGRSNEESRVLWGFPWQINGGDGDVGNAQPSLAWNNGIGGSNNNWQGLLNSPLM